MDGWMIPSLQMHKFSDITVGPKIEITYIAVNITSRSNKAWDNYNGETKGPGGDV